MQKVSANVVDVTRVLMCNQEQIKSVISSDLTLTAKFIINKDLELETLNKIMASKDQSMGIYASIVRGDNDFEIISEIEGVSRDYALRNNLIDGALFIDPFTLKYQEQYKTIYEVKNSEYNLTCWAFDVDYIRDYPDNVIKFHKAINRASQYFNNLDKEQKVLIARKLIETDEQLINYYETLNFSQDKEYSLKDLTFAYDFLRNNNYINEIDNLEQMIFKCEN